MKLPDSLNRKAVKRHFGKLKESRWDHLFECEKKNGLHRCRVDGDYPKLAYYSTELLKAWLIRNSHYDADEFDSVAPIRGTWNGLSVRRHAIA